ncbi:24025_t:CDS:2 [Gigaspora rosea]|nr:24025_t:CDS:2 [Gigaspora rosea]
MIPGSEEIQISQFLPLFNEITQNFEKISKVYHDAEHNKRICGVIFDRVSAIEVTVRSLKFRRDENKKFFTQRNYKGLQNILCNIQKLEKFLSDVTKSESIRYIQVESIKTNFNDLTEEFDKHIDELGLVILVDVERRKQEKQILRDDIEDINKYLENTYMNDISKQNASSHTVLGNKRSCESNSTFIVENPIFSPSFQTDPEILLKEMMKAPPYELTLSLEELLAPRKKKKSQTPSRPQNKFILFRKDYIARTRKEDPVRSKAMNTRDFTEGAKQYWEVQPAEVHRFFTIMANIATKRHLATYPEYAYEPVKKKVKQVGVSEENFTSNSSDKVSEENFMDDSQAAVSKESFTDDSSDEFEEYLNYYQCL